VKQSPLLAWHWNYYYYYFIITTSTTNINTTTTTTTTTAATIAATTNCNWVCHSVAVVLTIVQKKQIRISKK
jgi:hypothetical protein